MDEDFQRNSFRRHAYQDEQKLLLDMVAAARCVGETEVAEAFLKIAQSETPAEPWARYSSAFRVVVNVGDNKRLRRLMDEYKATSKARREKELADITGGYLDPKTGKLKKDPLVLRMTVRFLVHVALMGTTLWLSLSSFEMAGAVLFAAAYFVIYPFFERFPHALNLFPNPAERRPGSSLEHSRHYEKRRGEASLVRRLLFFV